MNSREIIKRLKADGWYEVAVTGKKGKVTVPHPKKEIPLKTLISIEKQANLKLR